MNNKRPNKQNQPVIVVVKDQVEHLQPDGSMIDD